MPRCCWTPTWFTSTCSFSGFRTQVLHSPFHSLSQRARAREGGRGPSFRLGLINAWIIFTSFHLREFCFLSASLNHSAWKRSLSHPPATHTPSLSHSLPHPFPSLTSFPSLQSLFCSIIHWRKSPPHTLVYTCRGELSRSTALASTLVMNRFVVIPSTLGAYWVSGNC